MATGGAAFGFDATGDQCAAAVLTADGRVLRRVEAMERGHAERAVPLIEELLAEAGLAWADLDLVAAARGPGSFTGVRIGAALIRGFALALGARAVGVEGFHALARQAFSAGLRTPCAAVAFGKPPRLIWRLFELNASGAAPLGEIASGAPAALAATGAATIFGPAAAHLSARIPASALCADPALIRIDPAEIAAIARERAPGAGPPIPLYNRPPDATPSSEPVPKRLDAAS